jgi:hypothetical protein
VARQKQAFWRKRREGQKGKRVGDRTRNVIFRNRKSHKELKRHCDSIGNKRQELNVEEQKRKTTFVLVFSLDT